MGSGLQEGPVRRRLKRHGFGVRKVEIDDHVQPNRTARLAPAQRSDARCKEAPETHGEAVRVGLWLVVRAGRASQQIALGTPQQCHKNATDLALADDSLIYCEGFAMFNTGSLPTLHAWVTDGQGRAIDNTWSRPGVAYAGVPFKSFFVNMTALKNHATISLLDDCRNNYPLRGDLGGRPDEWLEPRGCGTARVNGEQGEP